MHAVMLTAVYAAHGAAAPVAVGAGCVQSSCLLACRGATMTASLVAPCTL
jgi:hypothetical protein